MSMGVFKWFESTYYYQIVDWTVQCSCTLALRTIISATFLTVTTVSFAWTVQLEIHLSKKQFAGLHFHHVLTDMSPEQPETINEFWTRLMEAITLTQPELVVLSTPSNSEVATALIVCILFYFFPHPLYHPVLNIKHTPACLRSIPTRINTDTV